MKLHVRHGPFRPWVTEAYRREQNYPKYRRIWTKPGFSNVLEFPTNSEMITKEEKAVIERVWGDILL